MEATQQPFKVWFQIDQSQFFITQCLQRTTATRSVIFGPIGIEENQRGRKWAVAFALAELFHRIFDDPKTISSTADANIEMDMEAILLA